MRNFRFSTRKLPAQIFSQLEEATKQLNSLTSDDFHVVRSIFGRKVSILECGDIVLATVANSDRPTLEAVVALAGGNHVLFPGHVEADFAELCRILKITNEEIEGMRKLVAPKHRSGR